MLKRIIDIISLKKKETKSFNFMKNTMNQSKFLEQDGYKEISQPKDQNQYQIIPLASLITRKLKPTDINLTKLLEMAFIHDLGEIKIGDISTTEIKTEKDKQSRITESL